MGTKNNPGQFDCYAKAEPDEPIFTLRGKDRSAPYLVEIWTAMRQGLFAEAEATLQMMAADPHVLALVGDCEKFDEAEQCARAMRSWRVGLDLRTRNDAAHSITA